VAYNNKQEIVKQVKDESLVLEDQINKIKSLLIRFIKILVDELQKNKFNNSSNPQTI